MSLTEPDFDVWADAIENFKSDKHERIQALINKYGWPLNGDDMDFKDSIEYDFIKPYLNEAKGTYRIAENALSATQSDGRHTANNDTSDERLLRKAAERLKDPDFEGLVPHIYLDTKGFSTRTGVRTFEAAAYLRRAGAESSDVKRLFQSSFDQYMERQKLISSARDCGQGVIFAITGEEVDRIAAAQAADELLSIIGTHASVVAFRSGNDMAVSARAAGHVNVQLLMERLGGGGNHSAAGAQLKNTTPEEADKLITDAIRGYFDDQRTEKQDDNQ